MAMQMTYDIAMAISRDAGNNSMRQGGREAWSIEDRDAACDGFDRAIRLHPEAWRWLSPEELAKPPT